MLLLRLVSSRPMKVSEATSARTSSDKARSFRSISMIPSRSLQSIRSKVRFLISFVSGNYFGSGASFCAPCFSFRLPRSFFLSFLSAFHPLDVISNRTREGLHCPLVCQIERSSGHWLLERPSSYERRAHSSEVWCCHSWQSSCTFSFLSRLFAVAINDGRKK